MKKGLFFLLLCGSVFYAEASTLQPARTKRGSVVSTPSWDSFYGSYTGNPEDRKALVKVPESDSSIGDLLHKTKPLQEDEHHFIHDTDSKYDYVDDSYNGFGRRAPKVCDKFFEELSLGEMLREHADLNIGAFTGLRELEEADLGKYDAHHSLAGNIAWREIGQTFQSLASRQQVERYKDLLAVRKSLRAFHRVVGLKTDDYSRDLLSQFKSILWEEHTIIEKLLEIYRRVVTDDVIQAVEQTAYEQAQAAYEQAKAERAAAAAAKEAALAAELLSGLSLQKAPQDGDGVSNDDNI